MCVVDGDTARACLGSYPVDETPRLQMEWGLGDSKAFDCLLLLPKKTSLETFLPLGTDRLHGSLSGPGQARTEASLRGWAVQATRGR